MADLDPKLKRILRAIETSGKPPMWVLTPQQARPAIKEALRVMEDAPTEVYRVQDRSFPSTNGPLGVRTYYPRKAAEGELFPVLLFFHGGGWVLGDLDTPDGICRFLAKHADCLVLSVDYRLAPENRFPAAVEDTLAATRWILHHAGELGGDTDRVAVGGDSAGGNLAAIVAQQVRDEPRPHPVFQLLIYPVLILEAAFPSRSTFAKGYFLEQKDMAWCGRHYLRNEKDARDVRASPGLAEDLRGLPPALIITAGFDPLRDEAFDYAERLKKAGVPVEYACYENMIHAFVSMTKVTDRATEARLHCARALRRAWEIDRQSGAWGEAQMTSHQFFVGHE